MLLLKGFEFFPILHVLLILVDIVKSLFNLIYFPDFGILLVH